MLNKLLEWLVMDVILGDPMGRTKPYYLHDRIIMKYKDWKRRKSK